MKDIIDDALMQNKSMAQPTLKKVKTDLVDRYLQEIRGFESDRVDLAKTSAKNARYVAIAFFVIAITAVFAVASLAPLKTIDLKILRVNDTDGSVKMLNPMGDAESISYGEVLDKYWSRQFIIARNGYNWETVQDNYNLVTLMSNKVVLGTYKTYIKAPTSPVQLFSDKKRIKIAIQDVTFLPSNDKERQLAQIRFTRNVVDSAGIRVVEIDETSWNATITFDYKAEIKTADERELNPLAFRVTSYNEDRVL